MRRALGPTQVTWLLSAALAAGAVVLTTQTGGGPIIALHLPVAVVAVALGAGFFLAEQFLLNVEFRRQAHTFTLAGIPLFIGVLVVSPLVFVLTRLTASVLSFVWQRVSLDKMAYNSAAYAFEAAADVMLVHLLLRPTRGLDLPTAVTLIVVLAVVDQLISALVLVMIRVHNGPLSRADIIEVLVPAFVLSTVSSMFALSMIILFEYGALGAAVAAMLLVIFAAGYRAYAAAQHRHQSLALVHEFVTGGVGAQSLETLAEELLTRIRQLLRASTVQVKILDSDSDHRLPSEFGSALTLAVDEEDSLDVSHHDFDTGDWVVVRTLTQQEPLLAGRTTKDPGVRHWLDEHGFRDAMMVALPDSSGMRGTLRVTDRLGETSTFTAEDLTMLQTLTGHLAVALRSATARWPVRVCSMVRSSAVKVEVSPSRSVTRSVPRMPLESGSATIIASRNPCSSSQCRTPGSLVVRPASSGSCWVSVRTTTQSPVSKSWWLTSRLSSSSTARVSADPNSDGSLWSLSLSRIFTWTVLARSSWRMRVSSSSARVSRDCAPTPPVTNSWTRVSDWCRCRVAAYER